MREVREAVERQAEEIRAAWASGALTEALRESVGTELEALEFGAVEDEAWRGGRDSWLHARAEAAEHFKGQGADWRVEDVVVLPRSPEEAAVSYRVLNLVGGLVTQALFLETWARRDGRWVLLRHTGELAA